MNPICAGLSIVFFLGFLGAYSEFRKAPKHPELAGAGFYFVWMMAVSGLFGGIMFVLSFFV
jgi:hypothetical protein